VPADPAPPDKPGPADRAIAAGSPGVDLLSAAVQRISTQFEDLTGVVKARLSYDKVKEEAFERLYVELDELKKNAAIEHIKPLFLDLILLYDRMEHVHQEAAAKADDGTIVLGTLKSFTDELLEVLSRRDVWLMEILSSTLDYNHQRAIGVEDVTDPAQHQQVAKVVRRGFRLGSRVLRPEEVIVRRFAEPPRSQVSADSGRER
jgi:molecular chaperone GrpE (heat shock protein)